MILFVAHEAKLTGAPVALLNFLRWLRRASPLDFSVVVGTDGPLVERFSALAPVTAATDCGPDLVGRADLVYANSTASHSLLDALDAFAAPVLSHVHELRAGLAPVDVLRAGKRPTHYIAVSNQVRDVLVTDYPIAPDEVTVCEGFVWTDDVTTNARTPATDSAIWQRFGIPPGSRVVGAVGSIWPYKGPDLFVRLATAVLTGPRAPADVHFVWIGGSDDRIPIMQGWIDDAGLGDRVHVLGEIDQPYPLIAALEVFVVPSREDPFPLVLLEAGTLARCAVAFDAGGASQLLAEDRGILVECFDIESMAATIAHLLRHPDRRAELGARLAAHVCVEHDTQRRAPDILKTILQVLPG
ncbi:MAG: glycosyltransferase [Acidimicrobiales bacterium]